MDDGNVTTRVIRDFDELARHRDQLEAVLDRYASWKGFYYRWPWLEIVRPLYLVERESLFFVLFERGGQVLGFAPLQLEHKPIHHAWVRRLHFYGGISGPLTNLYGDLIIPDEDDLAPCVEALATILQGSERTTWDVIDLRCMPTDAPCIAQLQRVFPGLSQQKEGMLSFISELPPSFAEFTASISSSFHKDILRCERRLRESHADVALLKVETLTAAQREEIAALHSRRQSTVNHKGGHRQALFDDPQKRQAVFAMLDYTGRTHASAHYLLRVDQAIAAFLMGFRYRNTLFMYLIGFDDRLNRFGPAKILMNFMYQDVIADPGIDTVNWGPGNAEYKFKWCNRITPNCNLRITNTRNLASSLRLRAQALSLKLIKRLSM